MAACGKCGNQAFVCKIVFRRIPSFGNAVGIKEERIPWMHMHSVARVLHTIEHAEGNSAYFGDGLHESIIRSKQVREIVAALQ